MKFKLFIAICLCCFALVGCSTHRGGRIVDLAPRLNTFVANFEKYFIGKNLSLFKAAFFGTHEYNYIQRNTEGRRLLTYLNPMAYSVKGAAFFSLAEPENVSTNFSNQSSTQPQIYSCDLYLLIGDDDEILGLQPAYYTDIGQCAVKGCNFAKKMMDVFVVNYHDGITEEEIARNADVEIAKMLKERGEEAETERQALQMEIQRRQIEQQRAAEQKQQENVFLLSPNAKGSKVCKTIPSNNGVLEGVAVGFVEDSANGKIKVNVVFAGPKLGENTGTVSYGGFAPFITWESPVYWSLCN